MDYSSDKLKSSELGLYLGILIGILLLQATGQMWGLMICPMVGLGFGTLLDRITHQINFHQEGLEKE